MKFIKSNFLYLLRLLCRYYIAYQMFSYAFAKILKSQFDLGLAWTIDENISNFNGFMLTWYYYGYSRTYGLIIAYTQIAAALLLLYRKTERLGTVLFLSFMVNILLVNYFYEIDGAKSMSVRLTIMGLFLLFSDWKALKSYFFKSESTEKLIPAIIPEKFKMIYFLKLIIISVMAYHAYNYISDIKKNFLVKNEAFGIWEITPSNSKYKLNKLYIDYDNGIKVRDTDYNMYQGDLEIDEEKKTISFNVKHSSDRTYYLVRDSLKQLNIEDKEAKKEMKKSIVKHYNIKYNTLPFEMSYNYEIKEDTLILKGDEEFKFLNTTKQYKK